MEKNIEFLTRRWWRTARVGSPAEAHANVDRFCISIGDGRPRGKMTVAALADAEPLLPLPERLNPAEVIGPHRGRQRTRVAVGQPKFGECFVIERYRSRSPWRR